MNLQLQKVSKSVS